jgi:hypothetical protein
MDCDIDWEIPEFDLFTGRAERPLVGQENGAVGLFAGKA